MLHRHGGDPVDRKAAKFSSIVTSYSPLQHA
jgi:hypothetical protein